MSDEKKRAAQDAAKDKFLNDFQPGQLADMIKADYHEEQPKVEDVPLWEIDPDFLDPYKTLPPVQTWATIGDRPALPKEGIVTFSAKQKKGKSLSTYALAIPLLSGNVFDTATPTSRPNMIMIFDAEMSETTLTNRVLSQVRNIGEYGCKFVVCPLKSKSVPDRIKTISEKVEKYKPEIVVIDQCAKLVANSNDLTESNVVVDWLDQMSIGRSVWVVMHQNKSEDDSNMKGHLGSFLSYAAVEAYSVDRANGIFTITPKEARDTDTENAACVKFALNADGQIIDATSIYRAAQDQECEKWRNNMIRIFGDDSTLRNTEIIERIMKQDQLEKRAAQNKLTKAKDMGVIRKTSGDRYAPYELTPVGV